jgi:hypothetical protein
MELLYGTQDRRARKRDDRVNNIENIASVQADDIMICTQSCRIIREKKSSRGY